MPDFDLMATEINDAEGSYDQLAGYCEPARVDPPGYVYAFRRDERVKIGFAGNPQKRILGIARKGQASIIAQEASDKPRRDEKILHWLLREHTDVYDEFSSEWFVIPESQDAKIAKLIKGIAELRETVTPPAGFSIIWYRNKVRVALGLAKIRRYGW